MAEKSLVIYLGTYTSKRGKTKVVTLHHDLGYVWDHIFEFAEEKRSRELPSIFDFTRPEARKIAKALGFQVSRGVCTYEDHPTPKP